MTTRKRELIDAAHRANMRLVRLGGERHDYEAALKELGAYVYATERLPDAYPVTRDPYEVPR